MKARTFGLVVFLVVMFPLGGAAMAADPNLPSDPNAGFSAWALVGDGIQEGRIEHTGLVEGIGLAIGGVHRDAVDEGIEEWSLRGYLLAHALSTEMIGSLIGRDFHLPAGNLYGGLFGEYCFDRDKEWSGGYVIGGTVDWPNKWQTVLEYQSTVWNTAGNGYEVVAGLRRRF